MNNFNPKPPHMPHFFKIRKALGIGAPKFDFNEKGYDQGGQVQPSDLDLMQPQPQQVGYGTMAPAAQASMNALSQQAGQVVNPNMPIAQNWRNGQLDPYLQQMAMAGTMGPMSGENIPMEAAEELGSKYSIKANKAALKSLAEKKQD